MAEVYNEAWLETARDLVVAQLNALKTTMATGYTPTFSYVYEKHAVAYLQLNAVSIDLDVLEPIDQAWQNDGIIRYDIPFSIRVHTAYDGGIQDGQKQARLLNSIANKLRANVNLGTTTHRIMDISAFTVGEEFSESDTNGGSFIVTVMVNVLHTQE